MSFTVWIVHWCCILWFAMEVIKSYSCSSCLYPSVNKYILKKTTRENHISTLTITICLHYPKNPWMVQSIRNKVWFFLNCYLVLVWKTTEIPKLFYNQMSYLVVIHIFEKSFLWYIFKVVWFLKIIIFSSELISSPCTLKVPPGWTYCLL